MGNFNFVGQHGMGMMEVYIMSLNGYDERVIAPHGSAQSVNALAANRREMKENRIFVVYCYRHPLSRSYLGGRPSMTYVLMFMYSIESGGLR